MKQIALIVACLILGIVRVALAQNCIVPAPAAPPKPPTLIVYLPPDGGTQGCLIQAPISNGGSASMYAIGNAKCATAVAMAQQAAANDNGWNDGGVP